MNVVTLERLIQFKTLMMASINNPDSGSYQNNEWLQVVYPVGSIYISVLNTSPLSLFGFGTWEQIKDTFLLCAGDNYAAGSVGGEAEHVLSESEMPVHSHVFANPALINNESNDGFTVGQATNKEYVRIGSIAQTNLTGGSQAHNNMPPYLAVYAWRRVE